MEINEAARGALINFLGMEKPGFAVLIDAPWGAGKTHFVKEVCAISVGSTETVRYVTLNGVADEKGFRRALLKDSLEGSLAAKGEKLASAISKVAGIGDLGSLTRDAVEERLISDLPETLIFDDTERSTIPPDQLLGLINEFVEHQMKRVILLAHSEEHERKGQFLKRKEKLVGLTIKVVPDLESALPAFFERIPKGKGRDYLSNHTTLVEEIFRQSKHENLRLLRNSVRLCALVLDDIEDQLFEAKEAMARFVRTYLALSMAYAKGDISSKDINRRGKLRFAGSDKSNDEAKDPLAELSETHEGTEIYAYTGSVFPEGLSRMLIVEGYVASEVLNKSLTDTGQFTPQEENPLWTRMVRWIDIGWNELPDVVSEVRTYLFDTQQIEPGPYLHIADSLLRVEKYGGLSCGRDQLVKEIVARIESLAETSDIPVARLGVGLGWGIQGKHFSFGGYACDADDEFWQILKAMRAAQVEAFNKTLPNVREALHEDFENDLGRFDRQFTYGNEELNWHRVPILHELEVNRFAKAAIAHMKEGRVREIGSVFELLADRIQHNESWDVEREWAGKLRGALERLANEHGILAEGQLRAFISHSWKFRPLEKD